MCSLFVGCMFSDPLFHAQSGDTEGAEINRVTERIASPKPVPAWVFLWVFLSLFLFSSFAFWGSSKQLSAKVEPSTLERRL